MGFEWQFGTQSRAGRPAANRIGFVECSTPASRMTLATRTMLSGRVPWRTGFSATNSKVSDSENSSRLRRRRVDAQDSDVDSGGFADPLCHLQNSRARVNVCFAPEILKHEAEALFSLGLGTKRHARTHLSAPSSARKPERVITPAETGVTVRTQ